MKKLYLWFIRTFTTLSIIDAIDMGLTQQTKYDNSASIWVDEHGNQYNVYGSITPIDEAEIIEGKELIYTEEGFTMQTIIKRVDRDGSYSILGEWDTERWIYNDHTPYGGEINIIGVIDTRAMCRADNIQELYCGNCNKDTKQKVYESGHERDSSRDRFECTECGFVKYGLTGKWEHYA